MALYASLLLVGAATWGLVHYIDRPIVDKETESWIYHDFLHDPDVQLLRVYVRLDTSEATGSEDARAAAYVELAVDGRGRWGVRDGGSG